MKISNTTQSITIIKNTDLLKRDVRLRELISDESPHVVSQNQNVNLMIINSLRAKYKVIARAETNNM